MRSKRDPKQSKTTRFMYEPIRAVSRAWDLYLQSMAGLTWPVTNGNAMGFTTHHFSSIDPNHTTADEKMRDVLRLATARRLTGNSTAAKNHRSKSVVLFSRGGTAAPGGNAVALGRIDEDRDLIFECGPDDAVLG